MRYIVDTNVAKVANGEASNASPECRLSTIDFLEKLMSVGRLVLDLSGEIEKEYRENLGAGQPGVGNRFLQQFLTYRVERVERFELQRRNGAYVDFPSDVDLRSFDLSDRKFIALSRKSKAPIANAVDSDWLQVKDVLKKYGVEVEFLCSTDQRKWFKPKQKD